MNAIEEIVKRVWRRVSAGRCPNDCSVMVSKGTKGEQCPTCKCVVKDSLIIQTHTNRFPRGREPEYKGF